MALIDLQKINKQYDTKVILKDVNFTLLQNQRIAIIGQNGQGKSTLMKVITGMVEPDSGDISIDKSLNIQMLDQQPKFPSGISVREAIEIQLEDLKKAKDEYDQISLQISTNYNDQSLLLRQSELGNYLDFHNAWDLDNRIQRVLKEFKLKEYEHKPIELLSGGEQRRVSLAGLLLKKPDVLLLDEPTNHLDVYMVEFLEQLLLKDNFTLLFISHDRYFIDNIATSVVEIDQGVLRKFNGGYSSYLEQKEQLLANMQKDHENLLRLLKREAHWMQRGVTARRKRNERRKAQYLDLKKQVKTNPAQIRKMTLELQREQKSFNNGDIQNRKKMLFELDDVTIKLGDKLLIKDFTTRILQKDTIAIVGPNGAGKSTLLKVFLERIKINSGRFKKGDFKIGYFDQHREMLDDTKSIMETFCPFGGDRVDLSDGKNMHVYGYLKRFLLPREYLEKKIGALSGGEKNRVALALLFTKKVDCLILDEPTNDLDIPTINILEEFLDSFQGALIFVSHDRYFVDKIAKKLFVLTGKNGNIEEIYQSYSEYLDIQKQLKELDELEKNSIGKSQNNISQSTKKVQTKLTYNDQREYDMLPDIIDELENKIEKLNDCIMDPKCYEQKGLVATSQELDQLNIQYEQKIERFLELEQLIEDISNKN
jgi:ATP-binding cassette subfamily F protein uup